jgi:hypothetical protein
MIGEGESWIGKDLEVSSHDLLKNTSLRKAGFPAKIEMENLANTSPECDCYTSLLHRIHVELGIVI